MKHFILALVALVQLSCATQNSSTNEDNSMKKLIVSDQPVYVEGKTIDEVIDFVSYFDAHQISDGVYQVNIKSGITFKKCVFKKPVSAFRKMENGNIILTAFNGNVSFIDCFFEDEVSFRGSSIKGRVDFTGSTFDKNANFEELSCHENAYFNGCVFEESLRFQNAFFNQKANFMNAEFYDTSSFQNTVFNSELQFSAVKFFKYSDFALIDCRGKVLFNYTEFKDKADFSHSVFFQDFDFISTKNNTTNFNSSRFLGKVRFNKVEVVSSLSIKDSYFMFDIPRIDISSEKLMVSK